MYKIAFDVMGSDNGVDTAVQAAMEFLDDKNNLKIIFVGDEKQINKSLKKYDKKNNNFDKYEIFPTTEYIDMKGSLLDLRRKKDSSLVRALELVKDNKADGMLTGGNSAAFIGGAHFILGEFDGIDRPGFMPTWPTIIDSKTTMFLDAGANIDNSPNDLVNFAKMASIYAREVEKIKKPLVGLMNIGTEEGKGKDVHKDTFKLLKEDKQINFYGNIEPREMISGDVDIIVTDGFSGNIALKAMEGSLKNLMLVIKKSMTKNLWRKFKAIFLLKSLKEISNKFDYKNYAGAILLGINGIAFKSHGSSDVQSFKATLRMTFSAIENDVLEKIKKGLKK